MEIHPPHAIHSVKDFLLQLLTITIGILIALTLEGMLEWVHHRSLVHEEEANLTTEIHENQAEIKKGMQDLRIRSPKTMLCADRRLLQLCSLRRYVAAMRFVHSKHFLRPADSPYRPAVAGVKTSCVLESCYVLPMQPS